MLQSKKFLLMTAAVAAASPLVAKAAVITLAYSTADYMVSSDGGTTFTSITPTGTATAPILTVPAGDILEIGMTGMVTANTNPATATTYGAKFSQPTESGSCFFRYWVSPDRTLLSA